MSLLESQKARKLAERDVGVIGVYCLVIKLLCLEIRSIEVDVVEISIEAESKAI